MLGKYHVLIAIVLSGTLLSKILDYPADGPLIFILLLSIIAGSLLPDLDAPDSGIRHQMLKGKEMRYLVIFTMFNPVFAAISNALAVPLTLVLRKRHSDLNFGHRGVWHSLLGISIMSLSWFLPVVLFIILCHFIFPRINTMVWLVFPVGLFIGSFIHLLEDSFTRSGIHWLYPFKKFHLLGKVKTMGEYTEEYEKLQLRQKNKVIAAYFVFFSIGIFFLISDVLMAFIATIAEIGLAGLIFGVKIIRG